MKRALDIFPWLCLGLTGCLGASIMALGVWQIFTHPDLAWARIVAGCIAGWALWMFLIMWAGKRVKWL